MSNRTLILIIALIAITVGLLWMALKNSPVPPPTQIQPTVMPVLPQTSILFGSLSTVLSTASAKTYSLPIKISTVNNKVTVVQLELSYDPKVLTNVKINAGTFFPNPFIPINQVNEKDGRISYAISVNPQDTGKQGNGLLATLTFQTIMPTSQSTTIVLLPKSLVVAEGTDRSVLKATTSAQFTVGVVFASPTQTSSPSAQ